MIPGIQIITAKTEADFNAAKSLFIQYQQWLDVDLCFQSFDAELLQLPGMYGPPEGALLLAKHKEHYIGCVALRNKGDGICEMKRLFVIDSYKGQRIGRKLATAILQTAIQLGYHTMILDTLARLTPAIQLYQSLGFIQTGAYYANPLQDVVYMKLNLVSGE